jgi:hypothetical protein
MKLTIRNALVLIAVLSIAIGIFVGRAHRQRKAVTALEEMGVTITYRDGIPFSGILFSKSNSSSFHLRNTACTVRLTYYQYSDDIERELKNLPNLTTIEVRGHDAAFGAEKIGHDFPNTDVNYRSSVGYLSRYSH